MRRRKSTPGSANAWGTTFVATHEQLEKHLVEGICVGYDATERERELLYLIDKLAFLTAAKVKWQPWYVSVAIDRLDVTVLAGLPGSM